MKIIITGSFGLVGSEAARFFLKEGHSVYGIDNNRRQTFFGRQGSVLKNVYQDDLRKENYFHYFEDCGKARYLIKKVMPQVIIHAAAQPSHDWSAQFPIVDFNMNAKKTLVLLEATRKWAPDAVFIYVSTNKVYGDNPNKIPLKELDTRFEADIEGIDESMSVDNCTHSPFGVSKATGDFYAQEYGRYYGLKTGIFRCGCITGRAHRGAELHGFLSYLVRCKKENIPYKIYGYGGKQVRDNIHAYDLATAFNQFVHNPKSGEVYNMGGGRHSNISILEALKRLDMGYTCIDFPRKGDHKWYISNVSKFKSHYPEWKYTYDMERIFEDLLSTPSV